ncbi:MAG: tRNA (guanosine(46)-N7)-methyltransferase TrmB [Rickettsiaceae bacterium]|nr:tRNA (guanosine(46)-N7)-methyltransferase TrmB [Rickettsiaceae bacterium]
MEVGFGMGEHFADLITNNPNSLFIGVEVYLNGVANLLKMVKEKLVTNFLLWPDDLDLMLNELPDNLLDGIYILFPDPWPKRRYQKRRIINQVRLDIFKQKLKLGGFINFASDIEDYFKEVKNLFSQGQEITINNDDFSQAFDTNYKPTKYHQKALLEGREVQFLQACKVNFKIKLIKSNTENLAEVIKYSVGMPTTEKIKKVLEFYNNEGKLIGVFDQTELVGCLGYQVVNNAIIIQHISVLPTYRNKKVATLLINRLKVNFSDKTIIAETDNEALGFYKKLKFICKSIESQWGNRYQCTFKAKNTGN